MVDLQYDELHGLDLSFLDGSAGLADIVKQYVRWDKNPTTRLPIIQHVMHRDHDILKELLETRLQFGTAGLRGKMGAGYSNMNDLVIIQTTQGFVRYLEDTVSLTSLKKNGVVIGYDGRHNSRRFAELATNAFTQQGYPVHLFSKLCPTPFVPFAVRHFESCAGIMITASHNPKEDNGYKVYWGNGAQIISPHDKGIQRCIMDNKEPWSGAWETDPPCESLLLDPLPVVMDKYYQQVCEEDSDFERNANSKLIITYTPMHGVGYLYMEEAFKRAKFPALIPVEQQKEPDPEFPTVRFPNPEEGKSALNLAIETANENKSTLILANDPDADRLAVAEKLPNDQWKIFNGNELGALLGWWSFYKYIESNGRDNLDNCYMISSTVSSKILRSMAEKEGFHFIETLTGFKWMGNRAVELMNSGKTVLFAFEEAIGFMCGTIVLDKDGIGAGIKLAELATHLNKLGLTLNEQLSKIYEVYGYHVSRNSYYLCYDPEIISKMFNKIRVFNSSSNGVNYPSHLSDGKFQVVRVRDLTTGFDSGEPNKKAKLPVSRGSHMITFTFENGLVTTLRTSGTEPKIKYYTELCASPDERDWKKVNETLDEMVVAILEEWIQPDEWGFKVPGYYEMTDER